MHLLAREAGAIQQEGEAIDLGQTPGEIVFASSADSELSLLAAATDRAGYAGLRLANLLRLGHNLSVDLWLQDTVRHAGLVVLRLLGGPSYWQYGVDELFALAAAGRIRLAVLPGDSTPDPILRQRSTVSAEAWDRLFGLLVAGGPENADAALAAMVGLAASSLTLPVARDGEGAAANSFPRFGLWQPPPDPFGATLPTRGRENDPSNKSPSPLWGGARQQGGGEPQAQPGDQFTVPILFYRALLEGAGTAVVEALIAALQARNLAPLPLFVSSLKEPEAASFVRKTFAENPPAVVLNLTGFALGLDGLEPAQNPFAETDAPVIQLIQGGRAAALWEADSQGLSPKDLAMQLVMPELDGRIGGILVGHKAESAWHARTQCPLTAYVPDEDGIFRAVELAGNWARLRKTPRNERRIAIVLANYPIRDGRLANGVGYDAPQSTVEILRALAEGGYELGPETTPTSTAQGGGEQSGEAIDSLPPEGLRADAESLQWSDSGEKAAAAAGDAGRQGGGYFPTTSAALIDLLQSGPTNANPSRDGGIALPLARYRELLKTLPPKIQAEVTARWGPPGADPFVRGENFHLPALRFGNVAILLQPARGYDRDDAATYHDPDLVPPHAYLAAYLWLRQEFAAHAVIHNGKHGNLEWLPGKATALDAASYPAALWGGLPHLYPFIVNDPGEGTQAKRRTGAVIIDHLVPPLTRAETYGPLKDLEALLDEYYAASGLDRRRLADLRRRILDFARDTRLDQDVALPADEGEALKTIDNFLCELKEAQIRDGLHVFGKSPEGELERDLIVALARVPRGENGGGDASLIRALADDLKLGFDPLMARLGDPWTGPVRISSLSLTFPSQISSLRTVGDVLEALENFAAELVVTHWNEKLSPAEWPATRAVLETVESVIRPRLRASGPNEIKALLDGLDGKFVAPGPSGAPSRGRLDVLPTGRNFYSVDNRAVPTPTAWELGQKSAENLLLRHLQDNGNYLRSLALSVWGTANMRTGGDDISQALAFIGAKPVWDPGSLRVSGYEIIPLAKLGRPRVDVTLRISGFFRDAFPAQIALFDRAVRAIGALDEPEDQNPIAARMRADALGLMAAGASQAEAAQKAGYRIFGSKPGAYGAGLQGLMDSGKWEQKADLAEAFLNWGQYAYGAREAGLPERARFAARLGDIEAVVHNQDNREHDLLDSDDYYQFEGGLAVAAETLTGQKPAAYHNDHSRPERPVTRTLEEEISKVIRSRVINPKWINGVKRHGYKGAFEIIATVDYMFAFAATTGAVKSHHFDLAFEAFVEDVETQEFIRQNNRFGYDELIRKFNEARARGLWTPRSNSAYALLEEPRP
ncbi:MAG TPA: cobaltochelatase subunit CobN [Devosiaceae bacterium]|nr:cobaltochelatase subunit CobN [Devosiaceae bacterium]